MHVCLREVKKVFSCVPNINGPFGRRELDKVLLQSKSWQSLTLMTGLGTRQLSKYDFLTFSFQGYSLCCWRTVPWEIWPGRNVATWYTNEGKLQQIFSVKTIFGKHNINIFHPNVKAISGDFTTNYTDRERQKYHIHL